MVHDKRLVHVPILAPIRLRAGVDEPSPISLKVITNLRTARGAGMRH